MRAEASRDSRHMLSEVALATLPLAVAMSLNAGLAVPLTVCASFAGAALGDIAVDRLRGRDAWHSLRDRSALVIGVLLGLCLPPTAPLWLALLSGAIASVFGKQLFGGLGHNPFNPAMLAYATALVAWPAAMSQWPAAMAVDAVSGATVLDAARVASRGEAIPPSLASLPGALWLNTAAAALGGVWLCWRRLVRWREPLAVLLAMVAAAALLYALDSTRFAAPGVHLVAGAGVFAAFFIATEPVSAPAHPHARLVYCAAIGALAVLIRAFGQYPDGFAFAVLLMNACAPALDQLWRPVR